MEKSKEICLKWFQNAWTRFQTVHGRTRAGKFKPPVDYDAIAEVKKVVNIP